VTANRRNATPSADRPAAAAIAPLIEADSSMAEEIADEPAFDALRDDPRWLAALGRLDAGPPSSDRGPTR
jgi:hypothetical protein